LRRFCAPRLPSKSRRDASSGSRYFSKAVDVGLKHLAKLLDAESDQVHFHRWNVEHQRQGIDAAEVAVVEIEI
jgi:hypothetical protein